MGFHGDAEPNRAPPCLLDLGKPEPTDGVKHEALLHHKVNIMSRLLQGVAETAPPTGARGNNTFITYDLWVACPRDPFSPLAPTGRDN